eukprot:scaffold188963_cov22-Tisochrysis_lutea.AAC.1
MFTYGHPTSVKDVFVRGMSNASCHQHFPNPISCPQQGKGRRVTRGSFDKAMPTHDAGDPQQTVHAVAQKHSRQVAAN